MVSLDHPSLHPTDFGRLDDKEAYSGPDRLERLLILDYCRKGVFGQCCLHTPEPMRMNFISVHQLVWE
ncbi:hypothetical protein TNCV_3262031 [Trichonephila clavipes]|nr:hypothetical protein TNCV_3262031 [Trichonephila clavipes]